MARPAKTLEARENQLIALAVDEAEKRLRDGSASSQLLAHFLRLGTTREKLEQERLRRENELLSAKKESLQSAAHLEELYTEAMRAMGVYRGLSKREDNEELY